MFNRTKNALARFFRRTPPAPGLLPETAAMALHRAEVQASVEKLPMQPGRDLVTILQKYKNYANQEIRDWIGAINEAQDIIRPRREKLMELLEHVVRDPHVYSVMQRRIAKITGLRHKVVDRKTGEEVPELSEMLQGKWFRDCLRAYMETVFYGFSLLVFDYPNDKGFPSKVMPREHVVPELDGWLPNIYSQEVTPFNEEPYSHWMLPIGEKDDLGLLCRLAWWVIYKKYAISCWADYNENYGLPIRVAKYQPGDDKVKKEIQVALTEMQRGLGGMFPNTADIEVIQPTQAGNTATFKELIETVDKQISKAVMGSTMTTDDGASKSQGEVHERVDQIFERDDRQGVASFVNDILLPFLTGHGFPEGEYRWEIDEKVVLTSEQMINLVQAIGAGNIEAAWFLENFNIPLKEDMQPPTRPVVQAILPDVDGVYAMCCGKSPVLAAGFPDKAAKALRKAVERIARLIHGKEDAAQVDADLVLQAGEIINGGMIDGGTWEVDAWNGPNNVLIDQLRTDAFRFAGAKSSSQLKAIRKLLVGPDGTERSWSDFKAEVLKIDEKYNVNWLRAEYNHALTVGEHAAQWVEFQEEAEDFPLLEYQTAGDDRVRAAHQKLDGIILPVDHPFWQRYAPPNAWGCRCTIIQRADGQTDETSAWDLADGAVDNPMFLGNPATSGRMFEAGHPYDQDLPTASNELTPAHYGLSDIGTIYNLRRKLRKLPDAGRDDLDKFWKERATGGNIDLRDAFDKEIRFEATFGQNLAGGTEIRAAMLIQEIIDTPDEIYATRNGDQLITSYIAFFREAPVALQVVNDGSGVKARKLFAAPVPQAIESYRKGILTYRR